MTKKLPFFTLLLATSLVGCAETDHKASYMVGINQKDTSALTVFIADILAKSMDPASSTLQILPYRGQDKEKSEEYLSNTLREKGFALSPNGMNYPDAHEISYKASSYNNQILLELHVDDAIASCIYSHNKQGDLYQNGGCTIRQGSQLSLQIPDSSIKSNAPTLLTDDGLTSSASSWSLVKDMSAREQIINWGKLADWHVVWDTSLDWSIPQNTTLIGDFYVEGASSDTSVITQLIHAVRSQGIPLTAEFHPSNRVLLIKKEG